MRPLLPLLVFVTAITASADRLAFSDRARLVNPSDPQISPDGAQVVCVVSRPNFKDNRNDSELVLIDVASGAQRGLTYERRGLASPRWSPDGTRLAFLAFGDKDKRQIFVMPMRGGDSRRITDAPNGIQQFAWSRDGARIAYVTADEAPKREGDEKHNRSFEVGNDDFLVSAAPTSSHVWVVSADGGNARRLTSGEWSVPVARPPGPAPSPLSWSADGKWIAITKLPSPHGGDLDTSAVQLVDTQTGEMRKLTSHTSFETQPVFSPDGSRVAYWYPPNGDRSNQFEVWVAPAAGGDGSSVTRALDRNIHRAEWLPDGKSLIVGAHDGTRTSYWHQPLDGAARRLDLGDVHPWWGYWLDVSVARNGAMAFTGATTTRPREVYVLPSIDAKPRRLTDFNAPFDNITLGRVETITWKCEQYECDGVVIYPPGFDASKKYPLVLDIHGGPRSASTTTFSWRGQILAAHDWIVFQPNYRGSDNLGNAFTKAIVRDAGAGPGRDVMAGIEALAKRGFIDRSRVAATGWSYGGYMTSWLIGNYPAAFRAAVSGAAVNDLVDQYTLSDFNVMRRYAYGGSPFERDLGKVYAEQSPITYASRVKAPTLILSNMGDARVPVTQSFAMYHALKANNVPVQFIAYPLSGHSPEDPVHQSDVDRRIVEWLKKWL